MGAKNHKSVSSLLSLLPFLLGERYYVTFALWRHKSVCPSVCLSVTLLPPTQKVELFGNIFAPSNSLGARTVCIKILGRNLRSSRWSCKLNGRDMKNCDFRPICTLSRILNKIRSLLQWKMNRKSYAVYRLAPVSM